MRCGSSSKLQSDCCIPLAGHHSVSFLFNSSPKTLKILTIFDAKIVLIGSEICYTFFSQQLVPQQPVLVCLSYYTKLALSLSLSCLWTMWSSHGFRLLFLFFRYRRFLAYFFLLENFCSVESVLEIKELSYDCDVFIIVFSGQSVWSLVLMNPSFFM